MTAEEISYSDTLIQISTAEGWFVEYSEDKCPSSFHRLACWGLFQGEHPNGKKFSFISGVDGDPHGCSEPLTEVSNFVQFIHIDNMSDEQKKRLFKDG